MLNAQVCSLLSVGEAMPVVSVGADEMPGPDVVDRDGNRIGGLHDMMVDLRMGPVTYGVVGRDHASAPSKSLVAVPWNAIHVDGNGSLRVSARRDWIERQALLRE